MFGYFLLGVTFAFAAVAQPGPSQAWLIAQTASHGWRRTLPAAFSPLLACSTIVFLIACASYRSSRRNSKPAST